MKKTGAEKDKEDSIGEGSQAAAPQVGSSRVFDTAMPPLHRN